MYILTYTVKGAPIVREYHQLNSAFNQIALARVINATQFKLEKTPCK